MYFGWLQYCVVSCGVWVGGCRCVLGWWILWEMRWLWCDVYYKVIIIAMRVWICIYEMWLCYLLVWIEVKKILFEMKDANKMIEFNWNELNDASPRKRTHSIQISANDQEMLYFIIISQSWTKDPQWISSLRLLLHCTSLKIVFGSAGHFWKLLAFLKPAGSFLKTVKIINGSAGLAENCWVISENCWIISENGWVISETRWIISENCKNRFWFCWSCWKCCVISENCWIISENCWVISETRWIIFENIVGIVCENRWIISENCWVIYENGCSVTSCR